MIQEGWAFGYGLASQTELFNFKLNSGVLLCELSFLKCEPVEFKI